MFEKSFRNTEEFNSYLETNRTDFFDIIIENIKKCVDDDLLIIKIADIVLIDEDCIVDISVERDTCHVTMELAKQHYIETEQYEKCVEIDELKSKL